jgi:mono/diheme cytochrome c family protein
MLGLAAACGGVPGGQATATREGGAELAPAPVSGGREMFTYYCAKCHGVTGLGDGPSVGSLRTQAGLNLVALKDKSEGEIFDTVSGGKGSDMPPWELQLTPAQRTEIVGYIRRLQTQGK